jgi:serine/threonine protein kinase
VEKGAKLGRYEVITALGKGGMGEVYLARDTTVGRDVALKLLPDAVVSDANRLRRLRREARLLASLNHPNIASLYAFEEEHGQPFLVLELIDGETLAARLRRGRLPLRVALQACAQIADALAAAHARGVVHRDLKPSNVMLTAQGAVKLLDFGVARSEPIVDSAADTVSHEPSTTGDQIVGTPAYMSPEQTRGSPAGQQSDIWAFGCVLYESLTGTHAFPADTRSGVMAAIAGTRARLVTPGPLSDEGPRPGQTLPAQGSCREAPPHRGRPHRDRGGTRGNRVPSTPSRFETEVVSLAYLGGGGFCGGGHRWRRMGITRITPTRHAYRARATVFDRPR